MRRKGSAAILFSTLAVAGFGCESKIDLGEKVALDNVPAAVLKSARAELPGVEFKEAWKEKVAGEDAYEVRGRTREGKTRDVKVSASGKILEVD